MLLVHQAQPFRSGLRGLEASAVVSNQSFPRHSHDQFGIGVIQTGAQRSWSGIGPVEAGPGDVITVNPGEMHDGNPVQGRVRTWHMLYLDPNLVSQSLADDLPDDAAFARPALRDDQLSRRFARLFAAVTDAVPDHLAVEQEVLRTVAHLLIRHGNRPPSLATPPPPVTRALQRMDDALEQPVTLAELASLSGVSRFQLLRGFVRAVGITPHAYLLQRRVLLARRLLAAGRRPAEVAAEAGFADQSHLTRAFRRQFGTTPARYRAAFA